MEKKMIRHVSVLYSEDNISVPKEIADLMGWVAGELVYLKKERDRLVLSSRPYAQH